MSRSFGSLALAIVLQASVAVITLLAVAAACGVAAFLTVQRSIPAFRQLKATETTEGREEMLLDQVSRGTHVRTPLLLLTFGGLLATLVLLR